MPPEPQHLQRGRQAEDHALAFLRRHGLRLLERNFRCRQGEIDLIMEDADAIVFIEVRYRKHDRYGSALESVDHGKQQRLIRSASQYLSLNHIDAAVRFDVIGISPDAHALKVKWVRDAFHPHS